MSSRSLVHIIAGNRMAGIQTYASDICRYYAGTGERVVALTRGARSIDSLLSGAGVEVRNAPLRGVADPASIRELTRILRSLPDGPVVIHAHRYRDAGMAVIARRITKRAGIRIVASRHTVRKGRDNLLFRTIYRHIDAHIFVSRLAFERFSRSWTSRAFPLPADRVHILYNSLNIGSHPPLPEPQKGSVTAMYHGLLSERKGLENLIDALSLLRDIRLRLIIVGSGHPDFVDRLRRRAATRGVTDRIDWNLSREADADMISRCHFGVVPSVESEAFGLGNLRYMAFGRAQVSTRNGAPTEFLTDGETALLVPPSSASALADGMRRLALNPDLRHALASQAYDEFSRNFDWPGFIRKLEKIYSPDSAPDSL